MARTITVKGTGAMSVTPDLVILTLTFEETRIDYDDAVKSVSVGVAHLNRALKSVGYPDGSLKTLSFNVENEYRTEKDANGNYIKHFVGFCCTERFKLEFPLDKELLAKTLRVVTVNTLPPELSISFTVKDTAAVSRELLSLATKNAKEKAEILCEASGVKLGKLENIIYDWVDLKLVSLTRNCHMPTSYSDESESYFEPDDIKVNDSASFVWEII